VEKVDPNNKKRKERNLMLNIIRCLHIG